jgi:glycogen debranching enzyme
VRNRDGSLAEPPIALVEVQGYVYRAKLEAAHLLRREGDHRTGAKLESDAKELRARFRDAYWMPDRNMLAQAIQKDGRQAQAITSNPGQALWGGIVDADHARAVASCLTGKSMASGWGIRTLAEGEAAYNPIDYQVGSIWPHDNAMIAAGLKRYGFNQQALAVFSGIYKAATLFPYYRLPEVFAGFSSRLYPRPVRYPVACNPQAWAAGALPYLLMTVLGLAPNALEGELEIHSPALPDWLNEVTLRGVRIGKGSVDLRYERSGDATLVAVLEKKGDVTVSIHY